MSKGIETIRLDDDFYKLLRLSLRLTQEFPVDVSAEAWRRLYQTAVRQSLVGVCYQGVCQLPEGQQANCGDCHAVGQRSRKHQRDE